MAALGLWIASGFWLGLGLGFMLLGRAHPVIPPNLYSLYVNEHNSLGSPGKVYVKLFCSAEKR